MSFLDDLNNKEEDKLLVSHVNKKLDKIEEERLLIGKHIELFSKKHTKKKTIELLTSNKNIKMPKSTLLNMVEEYFFKKKYNVKFFLSIREIKMIKKAWKLNNIVSFKDEENSLLEESKVRELISTGELSYKSYLFSHNIKLNEDGEEELNKVISYLKKTLEKKRVTISEAIYYSLLSFNVENTDLDDL
jgi:hypothetical protein